MTKASSPLGSPQSPLQKEAPRATPKAGHIRKSPTTHDHQKETKRHSPKPKSKHQQQSPTHNRLSRTISAASSRHKSLSYQASHIRRLAVTNLMIGLVLAAIDGFMIYNHRQSKLLLYSDYTLCNQIDTNTTCASFIDDQMSPDKPVDRQCKCRLDFTIDNDVESDRINLYYGLRNFHQNYRFLMQSRSYRQHSGDSNKKYIPRSCQTKENKTILPCGNLANSMFDDEFKLSRANASIIKLDIYDIALEDSRGYVYKNPTKRDAYTKPNRWRKDLFALDAGHSENNGLENGAFIVWMTTSTFEDFVKLYAILEPPGGVLQKGEYTVDIDYRYGVYKSGGRKFVRIETASKFGPRNLRLIISLACLSLIYIGMFLFIALVVLRRWADFVRGPGLEP